MTARFSPQPDFRYHLSSWTLCPTAQRVMIALAARDTAYVREVDDEATRAILTVQRFGHADVQITEPLAMIELVEDLHGDRPLHPEDPLERGRHRAMMELGHAIQSRLSVLSRATDLTDHDMAVHLLREQLARAERRLATEYQPGEALSNVDVVFAPTLWRLLVLDGLCKTHLMTGFPRLQAWAERLFAQPVLRQILPDGAAKLYLDTLARRGALIANRSQADAWHVLTAAGSQIRGAG